ncbi:ATP-dependent RecD-like DNA helicase [Paraconexibacter sp. AEG42_29]|uniref:ATP-dependent RecD2 DNA helicase n=1 Tax=Paraconexibacter sp. AEG42_29 TaxID=2997339 RepID=A0AAU7AVS5_9ACTN
MAADPDPAQRELIAEITTSRWRAEDGDFAILGVLTDDGVDVTVKGPIGHVQVGERATLGGSWQRHSKHGWQFVVTRVIIAEPVGDAALIAYLAAIKHVGPRGAEWLLEKHGETVLSVIDSDPERKLRQVPGIGPAKLGAAVRSWESQGELRAVRLFLEQHGVPAAVAARIYRTLGNAAIDKLQTDPYSLTEVDGIGFATADALARALGVGADSPGRLDAGVVHTLELAELDGHCYLPRGELVGRSRRLLGGVVPVEDRLAYLAAAGRVMLEDERVAEASMYATERALARRVRGLLDDEPAFKLKDVQRPVGGAFVPTTAQWAVVDHVLSGRLSILTGGPGTGKTASMGTVVDVLRQHKKSVKLCAPTGKAARRLTETTGVDATTIHRLLEWVPGEGFTRDREHPIDGADVLIVDEASMLSVRLAESLLDAVGHRTHVLLVGDIDQLAPVGPGRVLEDLIDSGAVPTVRLTEIFRQAARSMIVRAAHAINSGEAPPTKPDTDDIHDFFVIARDSAEAIFAEIVQLAAVRLPAHYGLERHTDVQVLAPMHKGPVGIDAFNVALRDKLNPDGGTVAGTSFRVGDRVIQTKNDHEHELMNGELGVIVSYDDDRDAAILACDDGRTLRLPVKDCGTLRLGHAISIHKSQGSQMPVVVVPLFRGHHVMLTRNLIYTALTRAERAAVFVGDLGALDLALGRRDAGKRYTRLAPLLA